MPGTIRSNVVIQLFTTRHAQRYRLSDYSTREQDNEQHDHDEKHRVCNLKLYFNTWRVCADTIKPVILSSNRIYFTSGIL